MYLAVYGTLKRGYHNNTRYLGNSPYLGGSWVENWAIADEGHYPFAFRFPGRNIWVEVYMVDDVVISRTDRLEGVDSGYYAREEVRTVYGETFMYAQTGRVLTDRDRWFPDGVWMGAHSHAVPWLGWEAELRLRDDALAVAARRKESEQPKSSIYCPPPGRTGRQVKVWDDVTGEYIYVSAKDAEAYPLTKPDSSNPAREALVDIPKVPSKREQALSMIKDAVKENPSIPSEQVA